MTLFMRTVITDGMALAFIRTGHSWHVSTSCKVCVITDGMDAWHNQPSELCDLLQNTRYGNLSVYTVQITVERSVLLYNVKDNLARCGGSLASCSSTSCVPPF